MPLHNQSCSGSVERFRLHLTYIGAMGRDQIIPIHQDALGGKMRLHTLAEPAHSDCLEFTDGKVMICDLRTCDEITWERLLAVIDEPALPTPPCA